MRSDKKFGRELFEWQRREKRGFIPQRERLGDFKSRAAVSFSGHERDHLFVSEGGKRFTDVAGVSGLDSESDGRAGAFIDFDRDGYLDIALTSNNAPLLQLFRNNLGDERGGDRGVPGRFVAFRFVGGSKSAAPARGLSNRDGYGTRVTVHLPEHALVREHRCGDGFATQNSETMHVGIGTHEKAPKVSVLWPSGKTRELADVAAGQIVTLFEDPADSPDGSGVKYEPYGEKIVRAPGNGSVSHDPRRKNLGFVAAKAPSSSSAGAPLIRVGVTMATWCAACVENMPKVEALKRAFAPGEVEIVGLPVDPEDGPEKLRDYAERRRPAYTVLADLTADEKSALKEAVIAGLDFEPLPSTLVMDAAGNVLYVTEGVASVSEVRRFVRRQQERK